MAPNPDLDHRISNQSGHTMLDATAIEADHRGPSLPAVRLCPLRGSIRPGHPARTAYRGRDEGGGIVDDQEVIARINQLADEEHQLFEKESRGEASGADRQRLKRLEVSLDQCWDLLHQRRARRAAGSNPDEASVRAEKTVEGYVG